ncbi:hypothetical protein ACXZ1M_20330 [Duganella sp. PWIR1]
MATEATLRALLGGGTDEAAQLVETLQVGASFRALSGKPVRYDVLAALSLRSEWRGSGADVPGLAGRWVRRMIESGEDMREWRGRRGWTALMFAARIGAAALVDLLIPMSDLGAVNEAGASAERIAEEFGHADIAASIRAAAASLHEREELARVCPPIRH